MRGGCIILEDHLFWHQINQGEKYEKTVVAYGQK